MLTSPARLCRPCRLAGPRAPRGNCRLFDTARRNLARDGLSAGGRRIRTIGPARGKGGRGEGDPAHSLQWRGFSICGRPPPRKVIFSDLISSLADESGRIARKRMYLRRVVDREGEILDISAHYDSLIAVPATISKGANQSASAGGLGEGGNDDESHEVGEEDPGRAGRRPDIGRERDRVALTVPIALWAGPSQGECRSTRRSRRLTTTRPN